MQPLYAAFTQNINLAINDVEDAEYKYSKSNYNEYRLLIELRFHWETMISNFRMYLFSQLNAFEDSFRVNQLHSITELHKVIIRKLKKLDNLDKKGQLKFSTTIALEKFHPAALKWIKEFSHVKNMNESDIWRTDTIIYQQKLKPKLEKINTLLRTLDIGIERFSEKDLTTLSKIAQFQANSMWTATIVGLIVLLLGFVFLVKLILNPIVIITNALKDESKGIKTITQPNISMLETKNLITAFKEMRWQIHTRQQELEYHALHDNLTGLANRELLNDRLEQAIHNAKQDRSSFAILIMDLDRFKEVNDTLGHAAGDKLLQQVAKRLVNLLREVDLVVRLGGDEFSVL